MAHAAEIADTASHSCPQSNAVQIADEVTDKLAILDYQSDFCARKDQTPFSRTYFALPSPNAGMQFSDFLELVIWLMRRCEHEFTTDKYDDPNTTTNKMMLELKSMGCTWRCCAVPSGGGPTAYARRVLQLRWISRL